MAFPNPLQSCIMNIMHNEVTMKRISVIALLLAVALSACSPEPQATAGELLPRPTGGAALPEGCTLRVEYWAESADGRFPYAEADCSDETCAALIALLSGAVEQPAEQVGALSPEAGCCHRITLAVPGGARLEFLYIGERDLLAYREEIALEQGSAYEYRFFSAANDMKACLAQLRQRAAEPEAETAEIPLSPAQLRAAIDGDALAAAGTPVGYEAYPDAEDFIADLGPACYVLTGRDLPSLPAGRLLIVARTAAVSGDPVNLAITGVEIVDRYVKVRVAPADADSPDCAVLVDSACADAERIFVFVDADGRIVDALVIDT